MTLNTCQVNSELRTGKQAWREASAAFTWPVLSGAAACWAVRAAIDAMVAHDYGLTCDQYAHVLSTFSHASYLYAPRQCLAAFDELQQNGADFNEVCVKGTGEGANVQRIGRRGSSAKTRI